MHRELKPFWILYDRSSAGYFYEATFEMESATEFLATYEDRMRQGDVLHVGTHPPGLFLLSRFCLQACVELPGLVDFLERFRNQRTETAFRTVEAEAKMARPMNASELAALQLLNWLTALAVVFTIVPLSILASHLAGRENAWCVCCLWVTLPCVAIFFPKSDLLFPLTCTATLMFGTMAMTTNHRALFSISAGAILWLGMMLSLAHLPVAVLLVIFALLRNIKSGGECIRKDAMAIGIMAMTVVLLGLFWTLTTDCNIYNVWRLNLQNHEAFYGQFARTWWKWMVVNPLELTLAVGPPIVCFVIIGLLRQRRTNQQTKKRPNCIPLPVAIAATIGLLWISGKNQGEAARLWCFLTPWLLIVAGTIVEDETWKTYWRCLMAVQLVYCAAVVSRVSGFSF